jgi:hypothetical protein
MEDWSGLSPAEIRARVAAARQPALQKFLADWSAEVLPGERHSSRQSGACSFSHSA